MEILLAVDPFMLKRESVLEIVNVRLVLPLLVMVKFWAAGLAAPCVTGAKVIEDGETLKAKEFTVKLTTQRCLVESKVTPDAVASMLMLL